MLGEHQSQSALVASKSNIRNIRAHLAGLSRGTIPFLLSVQRGDLALRALRMAQAIEQDMSDTELVQQQARIEWICTHSVRVFVPTRGAC